MYHSTADSASETISITESDAFGPFALTTRSYCELIASNRNTRPGADGRLLPRTTIGDTRPRANLWCLYQKNSIATVGVGMVVLPLVARSGHDFAVAA